MTKSGRVRAPTRVSPAPISPAWESSSLSPSSSSSSLGSGSITDSASTGCSPLSAFSSEPPQRSTTCTARSTRRRSETMRRGEQEGRGKREAGSGSNEGEARDWLLCRGLGRSHYRRDNHSEDLLPDGGTAQCDAGLRWTGFRSTTRLLCAAETGTPGARRHGRTVAALGNWCGSEVLCAGALRAAGEDHEHFAGGRAGESGDVFLSDDDGRTAAARI